MKKTWNNPAIGVLDVTETAQNIFGTKYDGGYIGDGHIGLLEFPDCPAKS